MKSIYLTAILAAAIGCSDTAIAQEGKKTHTATTRLKPAGKPMADGYILLPSGLEYKIVRQGKGTRTPELTDRVEINISVWQDDSVVFDSRRMNNNKPVPLPITEPKFNGDPMEGFMVMKMGDSAILRVPVDSIQKAGAMQQWMVPGKKIIYKVTLESLRTEKEEKDFADRSMAIQAAIDDKLLQDYFKEKKIKATKTASGLYYKINKAGIGAPAQKGQTVSVNYTGMFMDGKKFDSNVDTAFHHVQPFDLEVGRGMVIRGWDEGLQLLPKGTKATFYIPSSLAYGPNDRNGIPANSILIFDVEIMDVHDAMSQAETDDKTIRDFLAKNNVKATKTASGLYYRIIKEGTGETGKPGQKATMKYLGKLVNGQVFDGNMDDDFNMKAGRQEFSFSLGVGQVIKGWDEGVALLKKGTRAVLYIPSELGYGKGGGGPIPPNAVLIFNVEVVNFE